jgi:uncharacterized protein (TIGR02594 family)
MMTREEIIKAYPEFGDTANPLLKEALKTYGVTEWLGVGSNPIILGWAAELADAGYAEFANYRDDGMPWCALWMAWTAHRAGYTLPAHPGWSQGWKRFGYPVEGTECGAPGDCAVFVRPDPTGILPAGSLGHVAVVVRAEGRFVHCIGGNQSDKVNVAIFSRDHLVAVRMPPYLEVRRDSDVRS